MFFSKNNYISILSATGASVFVLGLLLVIVSCGSTTQTTGFKIKANIEGLDEEIAVLQYRNMMERKTVTLDSAAIDNGTVVFEGSLESPRQLTVNTKPGGMSFRFYAENGDISITGKVDNAQTRGPRKIDSVNVSGSKINEDSEEYDALLADIRKNAEPFQAAYDSANLAYIAVKRSGASQQEIDRFKEEADNAREKVDEAISGAPKITSEYIRNHPDSHFAASLFVHRTNSHTYAKNKQIFAEFSDEVQNGFYGQQIKEKLEELKKASPGAQAAGFTATDINGNELSLKDFRGQYVLLDFWASWCKPCRAGNPHLLKLYDKYNEQGFEIIGISDDDSNPDAWRKAVKEDGIDVWRHVLRGLEFIKDPFEIIDDGINGGYAIETLPTKILINPEGKIIGRYGGGGKGDEAMDKKLKQVFEG